MITIAKTALAFHDLASWNVAALTIGRRACSSLRHRQIAEAWQALPLELIEACDDPAALVALERVADELRLIPRRGQRAGTKWEAANVARRNRLQQLGRQAAGQVAPADVLVLMACSATKIERPAPALELYDGPTWQTLRHHRGAIPVSNVLVLSGEYAFIGAGCTLAPYEARLTERKADFLIDRGIHAHNTRFGAIKPGRMPGATPFVEAGAGCRLIVEPRPYRHVIACGAGDYGRVFDSFLAGFKRDGLVDAGAMILRPFGGIGEQRGQLGQWLRQANGLPS
jgi:hypothetical protein